AEFPRERKYRFDLFYSRLSLASFLPERSELREAEDRAALVLIKELVRDYPDEPNYRDSLAAITLELGVRLIARGDYAKAEPVVREALEIAEQLDREYPERLTPPHYAANVARSLEWLGTLQLETERTTEAEASFGRALTVWEKLAGDHPRETHRVSAMCCRLRLATLYLDLGKLPEAQESFRQCLPAAERLAREVPNTPAPPPPLPPHRLPRPSSPLA